MIETIEDFVKVYKNICSAGWIQTHRRGPTGIGKTLEDLLGIAENNYEAPDFGDYELKSCRIESQSMLTILTKAPQPAHANTYLRRKYGYSSGAYDNDRKVLHATLTASRFVQIADTGQALKVVCDRDRISIASKEGIENVYWDHQSLKEAFEHKYPKTLVYAKAHTRGNGAKEEFLFVEAYELSDFDYNSMIQLLEDGKVVIDIRIGQYPNGRTHDHGTGFRIRDVDQPLLFRRQRRIV